MQLPEIHHFLLAGAVLTAAWFIFAHTEIGQKLILGTTLDVAAGSPVGVTPEQREKIKVLANI